jgi:hypothetical protein
MLAQRIGSIEYIVLFLSFKIFNIMSASIYLPTAVPAIQTSIVKPVYFLEKDPENLYFADTIEKYFARPDTEELAACIYFKYYTTYLVNIYKNCKKSR